MSQGESSDSAWQVRLDACRLGGTRPTSGGIVKITGGKVIVCSPGRNFVTLKLETADGVYGLGDATLNGREMAVASYLRDHLLPLLEGRDARRIEDIWQFLYKGAYWRRGPVTMAAIAAVDTALWDIKGKLLNTPVYQLLGGASREAVLVYGHANGETIDNAVEAAGGFVAVGYRAVRVQCSVPGMEKVYGISSGMAYEPAQRGSISETAWSSERYLSCVTPLFERLRRELGFDVHLLHDVHHRLRPIEAARLGHDLEPHRLFWMEDPTVADNPESFRLIRQHTTTPLAVGEVFNSIHDCRQLIQEQLIDYIRTTVVHAGGISHLKKIASLAELYQVRTGSHGATDLSPVCMAAALHFDLSVHNFGIQEYMPHTSETDRVFPHAYRFADGVMHPGDKPGLGVDIDEALAATFPYQPAYLPVARLLDGTMHDW
jgi:mannonate dehydratase